MIEILDREYPNFRLEEFVPRLVFNTFRDKGLGQIDEGIIALAQFCRLYFEVPMTINNWHSGGKFQYRGWRPPEYTQGAKYSQHRSGRAFDCHFGGGLTVKEAYKKILDEQEAFMEAGLTTLEDIMHTPTWLHMDIRTTNSENILIVRP
jgi:hypothetical protein